MSTNNTNKIGNTNGLKHGCYSELARRKLDGRTALAKQLKALKDEMLSDIGGNPSRAEELLIDRIKYKVARIHFFEMAQCHGEVGSIKDYVSLTNSLRSDLTALGLERREKNYLDLKEYIKKKEDKK